MKYRAKFGSGGHRVSMPSVGEPPQPMDVFATPEALPNFLFRAFLKLRCYYIARIDDTIDLGD